MHAHPAHVGCLRQARLASYGEASPDADTYAVAVNLVVVECDGSRPGRPDDLRGGEQARRHRAACNRGHGLLRGCVELKCRWCLAATSPGIIARDRSPRKSQKPHGHERWLLCAVALSMAATAKAQRDQPPDERIYDEALVGLA
jgi:hypothetical protein